MHDDLIALLRRGWRFGLTAEGEAIRAVAQLGDRAKIVRTAAMPIEALGQVVEAAKVEETP